MNADSPFSCIRTRNRNRTHLMLLGRPVLSTQPMPADLPCANENSTTVNAIQLKAQLARPACMVSNWPRRDGRAVVF